jgi:ABC-type Fe3+ transport system substrate-binding protein
MCGDGDDMADAVLLSLYKDFGLDGVRGLAANVRGLMHSSTMAAKAGKGGKGGAVHIIPAFFAESARQPAHVRVVWPDDGAAASPLYCLAKKSAHGRLAGLLEFFRTGFASIPGADWFVPASGGGRSPLPPGARLKWVGWEFVEANDVNRLRDELGAAFRAMLQAAGSGQDAGGGDACAS